jgi:hypothetical protein
MCSKGGEIEVDPWMRRNGCAGCRSSIKGNNMGGSGKESKPLKPGGDKAKKPPPPIEDDELEDGDIATPKRDRNGNDDEPL